MSRNRRTRIAPAGVLCAATVVWGVIGAGGAGSDAAPAPPAGRLTVCLVSLNEPHEAEAFHDNLDKAHFDFIDIHAVADAVHPPRPDESGAPWLANACRSDVRCDIMVYTGEFAGRFFGTRGSIGLQEMEEASCQARCDGLFRQPTEVFLMACNTLASKDQDRRTPDEYLAVLLAHGFDRAAAERVVELRYGPLGPSFRESLRRIFAGVPRIYGFSSVAPRGEISAPMLARYLGQGDYAQRLTRAGRDSDRNRALLSSFRGTALTQTTGLTATEAAAVDRRDICALYDESRPLLERLRTAYALLQRGDALRFVPTLQVFLARHPASTLGPLERSVLAEMGALDGAREAVLGLVTQLEVSALKLELAHFAALVGWLSASELHELARAAARQLLGESLTNEVVDVMCEITRHAALRDDFTARDIPKAVYAEPDGLRLVSCLAPTDPQVASHVVAALDTPDVDRRVWAAHALTRLQPRDRRLLDRLAPYLHDTSPDVVLRIRWLLEVNGLRPDQARPTSDRGSR